MELDILKQNTTWNDARASINNNFAKVKTALEQGGGGGGSIAVDKEMSDTSENAVSNKTIKKYVDDEVEDAKAYSEEMADNAEKAAKQYTDEKIKNSGGGGGEKEVYRVYENGTLDEEKEANTLAYQAALSGKDCTFYLYTYYDSIEASTVLLGDAAVEIRFIKVQRTLVEIDGKYVNAIVHDATIVWLVDEGDGGIATQTTHTPSVYALDKDAVINLISESSESAAKEIAKKQDILVSGTNIKTIGGESILGEGNIPLPEGGSSIEVDNKLSSTSENPVQNKVIYAELIERFEGIDELLDAINGEEI